MFLFYLKFTHSYMAISRNFEDIFGKIKVRKYYRFVLVRLFHKIRYDYVGGCNKCVRPEIFAVEKWGLKLFLEILSVWYWHSIHKQMG
jgi:hypothetical protein